MDNVFARGPAGSACYEVSIDTAEVMVDFDRIAFDLGYGVKGIPEPFSGMVREITGHLSEYCGIRAGYTVLVVEHQEECSGGITAGGCLFSTGKIIAHQLKDVTEVALFVCTIGSRMETMAAELFREGDPVKGHFTDIVASAAVEKAADLLYGHIGRTMAGEELSVTNRFSPGYCGWPVTEQYALFSFFPERFCGIQVTDSALMLPKKSVSGLIGIGAAVKREPYFCSRCNRTDCTYRTYLQQRAERVK